MLTRLQEEQLQIRLETEMGEVYDKGAKHAGISGIDVNEKSVLKGDCIQRAVRHTLAFIHGI